MSRPIARAMLAAVALLAPITAAQAQPTTLRCQFTAASAFRGDGPAFSEGFEVRSEQFEYVILIDGQRAYVVGNLGTAALEMQVIWRSGVVFIETTPTGTKQVTAIDQLGFAAHSRHTFAPHPSGVHLFPSQYYGRCRRAD